MIIQNLLNTRIERVHVKVEPRDAWVGVFWYPLWLTNLETLETSEQEYRLHFKLFVCLVPFLPIILLLSTHKTRRVADMQK